MTTEIAPWGVGPFMLVDTETTSTDPEEARIIEIYNGYVCRHGEPLDGDFGVYKVRGATGLINPGIEIPQESINVHGITNEHVQEYGRPPEEVLEISLNNIATAMTRYNASLVIQNAAYDLTVLDRECRRHGLTTLTERLGGDIAPVLDPMVIDKAFIKYRKSIPEVTDPKTGEVIRKKQGARTLKTDCQAHGIEWDDELAHGAEYDSLQTGRLAFNLARQSVMHPGGLLKAGYRPADVSVMTRCGHLSAEEMHEMQVGWYYTQSTSYRDYLLREAGKIDDEEKIAELKERAANVSFDWPIRPLRDKEVALF